MTTKIGNSDINQQAINLFQTAAVVFYNKFNLFNDKTSQDEIIKTLESLEKINKFIDRIQVKDLQFECEYVKLQNKCHTLLKAQGKELDNRSQKALSENQITLEDIRNLIFSIAPQIQNNAPSKNTQKPYSDPIFNLLSQQADNPGRFN